MDGCYWHFIRGKRVIFVAASPILIGKGLGEWIDSFDIVVRTNGSINLIQDPEIQKDYGSRCDVLYTNHQYAKETFPFPAERYAEQGVRWICGKCFGKHPIDEYEKFLKVRTVGEATAIIQKKGVKSALMGVILTEDLLQHLPKKLWLAGLDFYVSRPKLFKKDEFPEYLPGYLPQGAVNYANSHLIGKPHGHDAISNTQYFYDHWINRRIKIEETSVPLMKQVLGIQ